MLHRTGVAFRKYACKLPMMWTARHACIILKPFQQWVRHEGLICKNSLLFQFIYMFFICALQKISIELVLGCFDKMCLFLLLFLNHVFYRVLKGNINPTVVGLLIVRMHLICFYKSTLHMLLASLQSLGPVVPLTSMEAYYSSKKWQLWHHVLHTAYL